MTQPSDPLPNEKPVSPPFGNDPNLIVLLDAIEQYIADGHPVSLDQVHDPDAPAVTFQLERDIFEGYLHARRLELDG